jgi:hypothetical protein
LKITKVVLFPKRRDVLVISNGLLGFIAQLVERCPEEAEVVGSMPTETIKKYFVVVVAQW